MTRTLLVLPGAFGQPSLSMFSTKAMLLLKAADLEAEIKVGDTRKGPKRKLPVLIDDGETIPDSTFIRRHIETKYGHDFDAGLDARQRGHAHLFALLAEERLYWLGVHERWTKPDNAHIVKKGFEGLVPGPMVPVVFALVKRSIVKALDAQGLGRHTDEERGWLYARALDAIDAQLEDQDFLFGDAPVSADLSVAPCLDAFLLVPAPGPLRDMIEARPRLVAYAERMRARFALPEVRA